MVESIRAIALATRTVMRAAMRIYVYFLDLNTPQKEVFVRDHHAFM
jgi:hypothetical protein